MRIIYIGFFTAFMLVFSTFCQKDNGEILPPLPEIEQEVLNAVNTHRQSLGKNALEMNAYMQSLARQHSESMGLGKTDLGHSGFDDRVNKIWEKVGTGKAGENVAMSGSNGKYTVDSVWLKSPGHKANIEDSYTLTGIGVVKGKDGYHYYTQIFLNAILR